MGAILRQNLLSPIALAFALGVFAKLVRSEFQLPKDVYMGISIYLLLALGLHGGAELAHAPLATIAWPAVVTILLGLVTPVTSYVVLRRIGRFGVQDAAGIAAHYGSVSAVTFIAAQQFAQAMGAAPEAFMPTLLTLLESPGIHLALAIGAINAGAAGRPLKETLHEVLTGRTITAAGTTPSQTNTITANAGDVYPYFKLYGKSVGDGTDDVHILIQKAKCTGAIEGEFKDGEFWVTKASGVAITNGTKIYDIVQHETAANLPAS